MVPINYTIISLHDMKYSIRHHRCVVYQQHHPEMINLIWTLCQHPIVVTQYNIIRYKHTQPQQTPKIITKQQSSTNSMLEPFKTKQKFAWADSVAFQHTRIDWNTRGIIGLRAKFTTRGHSHSMVASCVKGIL